MAGPSLSDLERQRAQLCEQLAAAGDLRPGSINATYRRCGKPDCACAQPGHPGHGPRWLWTRSAGGKTRTRQLAAAELAKVGAGLAGCREFAALPGQIVAVNEAICAARPLPPAAGGPLAGTAGERGGSVPRSRRRPRPG